MNTPQAGPSMDACPLSAAAGRGFGRTLLVLAVAAAVAGTGLAPWLGGAAPPELTPINAPDAADAGPRLPPRLFKDWPRPDLALVITGQQHGYLLPCGCSRPQVGGLERRYNFLSLLRERGWSVVAVDVGDVPQKRGPVALPNLQGLIKYRYSMLALKEMGYAAAGIGEYEASLPLFSTLAEYALNYESPRIVIANLKDAEANFPQQTRVWQEARDVGGRAPAIKVGVTSIVGRKVRAAIKDPTVQFSDSALALAGVLKDMDAAKVDLRVLLYQGLLNNAKKGQPPTEAIACAERFPQFQVVACLSEEDEPSAHPVVVTNPTTRAQSLVISVGHKGKYVGVLGIYRTGRPAQPFEFRYQLAEMTEDYKTARNLENDHPIMKLMEEYTQELKRDNYLGRYGQSKHVLQVLPPVADMPAETPTFVGSKQCLGCHKNAARVWLGSKHSKAYATLVNAKRPSLRQHDAECVVCHVTGFGYQSGFTDAARTPHLENVGCESCHGPGSLHIKDKNNEEWQRRMNPWKTQPGETPKQKADRILRTDRFCQSCHDIDNDVHWVGNGFERHWKLIEHPSNPPRRPK